MRTDVVAGLVLAAIMVLPLAYYSYSAFEIAAGRFSVGGDLTGIYADNVPDELRAGQMLFMVGIPAVVAYVVWMLLHRYAGVWDWLAVLLSVIASIVAGYPTFATSAFSPEEFDLAIQSGVALLICVVLVLLEFRLRPRAQKTTTDAAPADEDEPPTHV